ncbi:YddF family protein [Bacillus atrophaeus]|uniref:YddF family protein n=1 Tax=Bacillus atrophaeus TaxID=1452 RepID=UPI002E21E47D|nr:YddF family protein [Bacillus atrophaeus]MED4859823.1 YddF family protein [Bacillus atrophaeus]
MEVALLNSLVLTNPGFYKADKITVQEVYKVLEHYGWRYKSFIGHRSTASFIQELLGIRVEHNRKIFRHMKYQKAICFNLHERFPEYKVLTKRDLANAKYQFYLLTRLD